MKTKATFTLTSEAQELLAELAKYLGLSKTATLEVLIREKSRATHADHKNLQIQAVQTEKE